jgi:hypothetical protein
VRIRALLANTKMDQLNFAQRLIYHEVLTILKANGIENKNELFTRITKSLWEGDSSLQVSYLVAGIQLLTSM